MTKDATDTINPSPPPPQMNTASAIRIPFNKPFVSGNELQYIEKVLAAGHVSGDGYFTKLCSEKLENLLGAKKVFLTTSCTHALEIAAILADINPGDEVIVPSFTFVSTINAFVLRGAVPVFADIRPDTLNIDANSLERLITAKTKAIVPVHYAGVGCDMSKITEIANAKKILVVEDNAHGLFGSLDGTNLGAFGQMSTLSFHETKNISCGEGGALVINDASFIERAEIIREKGTNRGRFFRGQVDKYSWVDVGSSYLPSDMLAAFLFAQLENSLQIQSKRKHLWTRYQKSLCDWAHNNQVLLPFIPANAQQAFHMFYLLFPNLEKRQKFIAHLKNHGVLAVYHYVPLHTSSMGKSFGGYEGQCPNTESISDRLVRLPFYNSMNDEEQSQVIEAILQFEV